MRTKPTEQPSCLVSSCDIRVRLRRGMCPGHYARWRKYGNPEEPPRKSGPKPSFRPCEIEGCENRHYARGWCVKHYARWKKHGDPSTDATVRGDQHPNWTGEGASYMAVHLRLRKHRGTPSKCEECGTEEGRFEWALDWRSSAPRRGRVGRYDLAYSTDLNEYRRLCHPCHREFDALGREQTSRAA